VADYGYYFLGSIIISDKDGVKFIICVSVSRCGTLLLYTPETRLSGVRIIRLTWVELWGFEPPGVSQFWGGRDSGCGRDPGMRIRFR
jgi:hypothetical protein